MKKVTFTATIVMVLGTIWVLYLRWDNSRFAESLPKVPSQTNIEHPHDTRIQGITSENEHNELPAEAKVLPAPTAPSAEVPNDIARKQPHHSDSPSDVYSPPLRLEGIQKDTGVKQEAESPSSFMDLSVEAIIERNRQKLIAKHGDIPEIDIYFKLNAPLFEAIKNRETQVRIQRTLEEHLEFSRVMSVLFPSEAHDKMYRDARARKALEQNRRKYQ